MIIQADEVPEFRELFDGLFVRYGMKVEKVIVDREGFKAQSLWGMTPGIYRRWAQHKNLHEVIKSRFPEALL